MTSSYMLEHETEYLLAEGVPGIYLGSDPALIEVAGTEAADYLQGQVTNDVAALSAGQTAYALLLNPKGKVQADMLIQRTEESCLLLTSKPCSETLFKHLDFYKIGRDVTVTAVETSKNLVTNDRPRHERLEAGIPIFGIDFNSDNFPAESGVVERAVNFEKGCYVGQEPVARLHYRGHPNRQLRGVKLEREVPAGAPLFFESREVGRVTSLARSPVHGPIALAVIRREARPGSILSGEGGEIVGNVVELPFE